MTKGTIFDIRRYSIHDGPGIRTTIFFKGCPLNCWWCHNPEGQARATELIFRKNRCIRCGACISACPEGAVSRGPEEPAIDRSKCAACGSCVAVCYAEAREMAGREVEPDEVMAQVERDTPFYQESGGGVTFSGGEPLAQPEFLHELLRACRKAGIHAAVDTSGLAAWEVFENIYECVDLFMYDIKLIDEAEHRKFTGVPNDLILKNLQALSQKALSCRGNSCRRKKIVLRLPVIPGINDDDKTVRQIGTFAAALPSLEAVSLLPYHRIGLEKYARLARAYKLPETPSPSEERLLRIAELLSGLGLSVRMGD